MFCGNCGTQVPDGAAVCPNCGTQIAPKSQAPQMNQAFQNAGQGAAQGAFNQNAANQSASKKFDSKKIGIIAGIIVAVIIVIFVLKAIFGGSGLKGAYTDGYTVYSFSGNKMTVSVGNMEITANYKTKKNKIVIDPKTVKFTDATLDYFEDELDLDKDEIEDMLDEYTEEIEDEAEVKYKYDKDKKVLTLDGSKYYYAENYKVGPSGKFTSEDDDDITITFKNGKATYDDDGDKETLSYYCYDNGDDVKLMFYGLDFYDSDFYEEYYTSTVTVKDDDEVTISGYTFEK